MYEMGHLALALHSRPSSSSNYQMAAQKSFWNRLKQRLNRSNELLSLSDYLCDKTVNQWQDLGVKTVAIEAITGSVSRKHDFDRDFMPRQPHTRFRWLRVDQAYYHDKILPPIELWKVDDVYFVFDGHHRLSVARLHNQAFIDAHVIKITVDNRGRLSASGISKKRLSSHA